jgi:hypothetical protein
MQAYLLGAKNTKSVQFCDLCSSVILPLQITDQLHFYKGWNFRITVPSKVCAL